MKKKALTFILISAVTAHLIGGCAAPNSATNQTQRPATTQSEEISSASQIEENIDNNGESAAAYPYSKVSAIAPYLFRLLPAVRLPASHRGLHHTPLNPI